MSSMVFIMSASPVCLLRGGSVPRPTASHRQRAMLKSSSGTAHEADNFAHRRAVGRPCAGGTWPQGRAFDCGEAIRYHQRRPSEGQSMTTDIQERSRASSQLNQLFSRFAQKVASWTGNPIAFLLALAMVLVWIVTGPIFNYSDTWQLVINTGTTIVTFLMVFLIQNTQNRDARAINLKLNELIRAQDKASDQMIDIEKLSDLELEETRVGYEA